MRKRKEQPTCTESQEIRPEELRPGQSVRCGWGYSRLVSVEHTDTHYTMHFDCQPSVRASRSNWPFIATGRKVCRSEGPQIMADGRRF